MARAQVGDIELEYEVIGSGQPLLLVQGFATQMICWDDGFCEQLARQGFQVIRYDNRDVGLSSRLDHLGVPDGLRAIFRAYAGLSVKAPYDLYDMAADGIGLLDALGIERAHVMGASMGGMIVQCMAITHAHRLRSVTSVMSTTGARWASIPSPSAFKALLRRPPSDVDAAAETFVEFFKKVRGPRFTFDEDEIRAMGRRVHQRSFYIPGAVRHLTAIAATPDRTAGLRRVSLPFLVVHGTHDPLVPVVGGLATHRAVPGSRLKLIDGMGHELPRGAWPLLAGAVARHARAS